MKKLPLVHYVHIQYMDFRNVQVFYGTDIIVYIIIIMWKLFALYLCTRC